MKVMVVVGLACVCAALFGVVQAVRRRAEVDEQPTECLGRPYVRILRSPQELQNALALAAEAERGVAEVVIARADRYEASIKPSRSVAALTAGEFPIDTSVDTSADMTPTQRRSA